MLLTKGGERGGVSVGLLGGGVEDGPGVQR